MTKKKVAVLGSTGSIGKQALDVIACQPDDFEVISLVAKSSREAIEKQAKRFRPAYFALTDGNDEKEVFARACEGADIALVAVVGISGLWAALAAINAGADIALANKESLVCGGELIKNAAAEKGVRLLPVDSEHSAIFQCLMGQNKDDVSCIWLTASGGPLRGMTKEQIRRVGKEEVLAHPTWSMGPKITVDSASMMNKGLEIIEAGFLFDMPEDKIRVVIHPESILHSAVAFRDNAVIGQMALPDMRQPISFALNYPKRMPCGTVSLDFTSLGRMSFMPPDEECFPALGLAREAMRRGGIYPCVLSSANERAVSLFLQDKIPFCRITEAVDYALQKAVPTQNITADAIINADSCAIMYADEYLFSVR